MKKLLLIDAYAMIYRAYYALIRNPRTNSKGMNTSAIFGFVNTLEDVIKRENPTHVGVAFDPKGKTFRHEAYEAYKQQREATPEDIRVAIPYIKQIVAAYNIPILEMEGFEADDVIGTMAKQAEQKDFTVLMLTPDKDYGQLVSERVFMYRPRHTGGFELMGVPEVCAKYELKDTAQVIDFLGLMGDASDNIPGCPGVGDKRAKALLKEFESIENLLENTDKLKGAMRANVENNVEQIRFSKFLATIKTDVPMPFNEEVLQLTTPNESVLLALYQELEFRTFIAKLGNKAPAAPPQQGSLFDNAFEPTPQAATPVITPLERLQDRKHKYQLIESDEQIAWLVGELCKQEQVSFDTETTGTDAMISELIGMSFSYKKGEAYFVILPEKQEECTALVHKFDAFWNNAFVMKIGQNLKYDLLILKNYGVNVQGEMFDTMIAHYLIQPELRHGMDYLAEIYLNYQTIHYEDLTGKKGKNQLTLRQVETEKLVDYACEDADITLQLYKRLKTEISDKKLNKLFYDIEVPLMQVLVAMEFEGVKIDEEALATSSKELTAEQAKLEQEIQALAGLKFNVSSPKQVGEVLFEQLKIDEKAKKTKTGQYSTSEDVLEKLRSKHPIVAKILDYRGIKKLLSTYIDALPELVNPRTGRVHTSYNQTVVATGRLSSSNPNLQNIPIRTEQGKEIRRAFIPHNPNSVFLSADYSQVELRIMAHLSGDENMITAFRSGHDIHAATAAKIYNLPIEEVTSDMRRKAKTANFGIIYGISVFGLSERLGIPRAEAKELINGYFSTYPKVKAYMDASIAHAKEQGYVETLLGRKRMLSDINSQNSIVRGFAERNAINAPIQGTAADIVKIAMVNIQRRLQAENLHTKMIMQVHDELNFSVPNDEIAAVQKLVSEEMEHAIQLNVPLKVDGAAAENWLLAH